MNMKKTSVKNTQKKKSKLVEDASNAVSVEETNSEIEDIKALLIRMTVAVEEMLHILRLKKPISAEELYNGK